jgi:hypothetical protein
LDEEKARRRGELARRKPTHALKENFQILKMFPCFKKEMFPFPHELSYFFQEEKRESKESVRESVSKKEGVRECGECD